LDSAGAGAQRSGLHAPPQRLDVVAVQRLRSEAELEAVVVRRVVAAGHLHPTAQLPMEDGEVEQRRRAHPDVDHVDAGGADAVAERGGVGLGGQPAVAAHGDQLGAPLRRQRTERLAQSVGEPCVEVALRHPADVILAEDAGIQLNTSTECLSRSSLESQSSKRWPIALSYRVSRIWSFTC